MLATSEFILHDANHTPTNEKSGKIPSRASSGASSSGFLYRATRNDLHQANDVPRGTSDRRHGITAAMLPRDLGAAGGGGGVELSSDEGNGEDLNDTRHESMWEEQLMHESLTEAELWQVQTKDHPKLPTKLTDSEIKRQETIYEFIKTERSHLRTLQLMKNVWRKGLEKKPFKHIKVDKLLPGIDGMIYQSRKFLLVCHERQIDHYPMVEYLGDVILKYWLEEEDDVVKVFGYFCSLHYDALAYYKELMAEDKKFAQFIHNTRAGGNTRRLDLPDCMQLAMQRITKYQLMVSKIRERTRGRELEQQNLAEAVEQVMRIAERVDQQVKFVSREKRLQEICKKLDTKGKAVTIGRKTSFSKDDMKYDKRRLLFESKATIKIQAKPGKKAKDPVDVILLLMTDYVVMLKANTKLMTDGHNYSFIHLGTGQPTVLPLRGLIIRENPTSANERYILSAKHVEIGLYELIFKTADKATIFAEQVRLAAANCPDSNNDGQAESDEELARQRKREQRRTEERFVRCNELLTKIRSHETRIISLTNEKITMSHELRAITTNSKTPDPQKLAERTQTNDTMTAGNQQLEPIVREAQRLTKELPRSDTQVKLTDTLGTAFTLSTRQDTYIATLQTAIAKYDAQSSGSRESKDLNQMERFHDIESKRFDRQRKKEKEELRKQQQELAKERDDLDRARHEMEREKADIERQRLELEKEKNLKLRQLQDKNLRLERALLDKDQSNQTNLLKIRDMQRQLDESIARLDGHTLSAYADQLQVNSGSHGEPAGSPKSHHSASPSGSFSKADSKLLKQKRSNSHGHGDPKPSSLAHFKEPNRNNNNNSSVSHHSSSVSANSLRRVDSLSPDRQQARSQRLQHKYSDTSQGSSEYGKHGKGVDHGSLPKHSTAETMGPASTPSQPGQLRSSSTKHHRSVSSLSAKLSAISSNPTPTIAGNAHMSTSTTTVSASSSTAASPQIVQSEMLLPLQLSASTTSDAGQGRQSVSLTRSRTSVSNESAHSRADGDESKKSGGLSKSGEAAPTLSSNVYFC